MPPVKTEQVMDALRTVVDPEVGINVVDLGLVYDCEVKDRNITVIMTMTTPACPLGSYLQQSAEQAIRARLPEAMAVEITTVWQPVWAPSMMSQDAKQQLGWEE